MARRQLTFMLQRDRLLHQVCLADDRRYRHTCTLGVFKEVAGYADEYPQEALATQSLARQLNLPFSQVQVALDFPAEYGLTVRAGRKWHPQAPCLYEEAIAHFYSLSTWPRQSAHGSGRPVSPTRPRHLGAFGRWRPGPTRGLRRDVGEPR